jgi:flagellar hook-basal body complex protein FliE
MASDLNLTRAAAAYAKTATMPTAEAAGGDEGLTGPSFKDLLGNGLTNAIADTGKAEISSMKASIGKAEVTDLVTAVTNAELTLQAVVAVRDKVIAAYQEIMRMPV